MIVWLVGQSIGMKERVSNVSKPYEDGHWAEQKNMSKLYNYTSQETGYLIVWTRSVMIWVVFVEVAADFVLTQNIII